MKTMNKFHLIIIVLVLLCLLGGLGYTRLHIEEIGGNVGTLNGNIVGMAIGSWKGITEGSEAGAAAGAEAGLSASDTEVDQDIAGSIESVGRLEVLAAGVRLQNLHAVGNTYKVLYVAKGDAVFSVNLAEADVSYSEDGKEVTIHIPEPTVELYLDENSTGKLAEMQKFSWSVGAKDGINAYLNSMVTVQEKVEETIDNYDSLMETAKEAAISQVTQLAGTVCGEDRQVHVEFL